MQQVQLYSLLFQWRLPPLYRSYHAVGKECFLLRSYLLGDSSEEAASSLSVTVSLLVLFWSTRLVKNTPTLDSRTVSRVCCSTLQSTTESLRLPDNQKKKKIATDFPSNMWLFPVLISFKEVLSQSWQFETKQWSSGSLHVPPPEGGVQLTHSERLMCICNVFFPLLLVFVTNLLISLPAALCGPECPRDSCPRLHNSFPHWHVSYSSAQLVS